MKRVTILGATGYTGHLICDILDKRAIPFSVAVRNPAKLQAYKNVKKTFTVDLNDHNNHNDIQKLIAETDILVNCVGPYAVFGQELIKEVRKNSLYYLDLTGEQSFVKQSYEAQEANANKACLIHSCSFESALADLMAFNILKTEEAYQSINSFYYFESSNPSGGTRFTMKVHGYFDQFAVTDGQLVKVSKPYSYSQLKLPYLEKFNSALFAPYPEVLFFKKHFNVKESGSFLVMEDEMVQFALERPEGKRLPLETVVERLCKAPYQGPPKEVREQQFFRVGLQATDTHGQILTSILSGKDMYGVTAELIVSAISLLQKMDKEMAVVLSPAQAFYKEGMLKEIIERCDLSLESSSTTLQNLPS